MIIYNDTYGVQRVLPDTPAVISDPSSVLWVGDYGDFPLPLEGLGGFVVMDGELVFDQDLKEAHELAQIPLLQGTELLGVIVEALGNTSLSIFRYFEEIFDVQVRNLKSSRCNPMRKADRDQLLQEFKQALANAALNGNMAKIVEIVNQFVASKRCIDD